MQSSMSQMPLPAGGQGRVSGAFRSQLMLLLLPVFILLLVGASSLGLQIASHQGLELGYPTPNVHITSMPSGTITVGDQVSFAADSPGRDLVYKWDFGDGGTATGPSVNYTYQQLNESNNFAYTVTVTVTDVLGRISCRYEFYRRLQQLILAILRKPITTATIRRRSISMHPAPISGRKVPLITGTLVTARQIAHRIRLTAITMLPPARTPLL